MTIFFRGVLYGPLPIGNKPAVNTYISLLAIFFFQSLHGFVLVIHVLIAFDLVVTEVNSAATSP
eukprot:c50120_g1_i1 orf=1-189(-)